LFVCREYPPAAYPPGGIGTYVQHISRLFALAGETVHIIAHRWHGAPKAREISIHGRLIVHRVAFDEVPAHAVKQGEGAAGPAAAIARGLLLSSFPSQTFAWQAARLAERLVDAEGIDVIEAQEWEAPLYYLQLRRALNLGPRRRPPCVVHVHSPSERIFAANGWDTAVADYRPATELEAYSIAAADAILCPSQFVANETIARYRVNPSDVTIIPYPLGDAMQVDRAAEIWASDMICHVGRLEPRKGVLEWVDAMALVAGAHPKMSTTFVGGDTPLRVTGGSSVKAVMLARATKTLRGRLHFLGSRDRAGVVQVLSQACAAVVPSRWENFPYSCIEAMASGLPVIASPNGGMQEMIVDGESGWIAPDATPVGLSIALQRALATPPHVRAEMGAAAAQSIRTRCDGGAVVRRHLDVKARLAAAAASRSSAIRASPLSAEGPSTSLRNEASAERRRVDVVLRSSPEAPRDVARDPALLALVFVAPHVELDERCVAVCAETFARDPLLGIMSAWTREGKPAGRIRVPPCPSEPHVWNGDAPAPWVAVRATAYHDAICRWAGTSDPPALRDVFDAIAHAGWSALTYPDVLASLAAAPRDSATWHKPMRYSSMARAVQRLHMPILEWLRECSPEDRRALLRDGFSAPMRSTRWLTARAWRFLRTPSAGGSAETL
jgi:glycosyltransferase involved in cell wall biosynthesis